MESAPCSSRQLAQPPSRQLQCLIPGRVTELAVLLDEGSGEAFRRVDVFDSKLALDTQVAVVGDRTGGRRHAHDPVGVSVHVQFHRATDAAVRTYRAYLVQVLGLTLTERGAVVHGAGGAGGDTRSAQHAGGLIERHVEGCRHFDAAKLAA